MQVKKYRANSTREALEQIKRDLGEDAFVLETKQVRVGGFLGMGSEMQIEISAAAPATANDKTNGHGQKNKRNGSSNRLSFRSDIRKCLTMQATTNPQDAIMAARKFEMYGADCLALTKIDETTRPGALVEIVAEANLPLIYLCAGQRVPEDLQTATPESFAARILYGQDSITTAA